MQIRNRTGKSLHGVVLPGKDLVSIIVVDSDHVVPIEDLRFTRQDR